MIWIALYDVIIQCTAIWWYGSTAISLHLWAASAHQSRHCYFISSSPPKAWPECSKHNKERNKHGLNVRNTTKKERSKKTPKTKTPIMALSLHILLTRQKHILSPCHLSIFCSSNCLLKATKLVSSCALNIEARIWIYIYSCLESFKFFFVSKSQISYLW